MSSILKTALEGSARTVTPVLMPESKNIQRAKQDQTREKKIKVSGPLSEIYTQALNVVFAKRQDEDRRVNFTLVDKEGQDSNLRAEVANDAVAHESQANDAIMSGKLYAYLMDDQTAKATQPIAHVYVTNRNSFRYEDFAKAAQLKVVDKAGIPVILAVVDPSQGDTVVSNTTEDVLHTAYQPEVNPLEFPHTPSELDTVVLENLAARSHVKIAYNVEQIVDYIVKA